MKLTILASEKIKSLALNNVDRKSLFRVLDRDVVNDYHLGTKQTGVHGRMRNSVYIGM